MLLIWLLPEIVKQRQVSQKHTSERPDSKVVLYQRRKALVLDFIHHLEELTLLHLTLIKAIINKVKVHLLVPKLKQILYSLFTKIRL